MRPQKQFSYRDNQALDKDITTLFDWVGRIDYTEDNPDGVRKGKIAGEAVLLKTGGKFYLEVCTAPNSTVWRGVELTNTP